MKEFSMFGHALASVSEGVEDLGAVTQVSLRVALVGFDEEGFDAPVLEARTFSALKTHDPALVRLLAAAAESLIDDSLSA